MDVEHVAEPVAPLELAQHAQIGVIPLPALMSRSLLGQRVGHPELALDLAEVDHLTRARPAA